MLMRKFNQTASAEDLTDNHPAWHRMMVNAAEESQTVSRIGLRAIIKVMLPDVWSTQTCDVIGRPAHTADAHTYCHVEHHACCHFALIAGLEKVDGFPELEPHAKTNVLGQMLNQTLLTCILQNRGACLPKMITPPTANSDATMMLLTHSFQNFCSCGVD